MKDCENRKTPSSIFCGVIIGFSFPAVRFFISLKNNSVIKFQIFDIFLFFRIFLSYFWNINPLLSRDQHETSSAHGTCCNSMILKSILKSAKPIYFFPCLKIEKTAKKHYFFIKIDFLGPNSAQSRPNFQIFTFTNQDVNVLL